MTLESMMQLQETICLLLEHFKKDPGKSALWMMTPNPSLGNSVPFEFFLRGRGHKVLSFVKNALEENLR